MKLNRFALSMTVLAMLASCASLPPKELVDARAAYNKATVGPAPKLAPAELHKAHEALALAEQSFRQDPQSYATKDLAYVAQRKAELAGALGLMLSDRSRASLSNAEFQAEQSELVKQGRVDLAASEQRNQQVRQTMEADRARQELSDSERRTAEALAALAALAAVKEEKRGLVITLSGSVLFASSKASLLGTAKTKLDQVAKALLEVPARNLTIEGHSDSQGSDDYNMDLSKRRANAVRDYLIERNYQSDRIQAVGMGEGNPIADNGTPEGRANNRRVEIVVHRDERASK